MPVRRFVVVATSLGALWLGWRFGRSGGWFDLDVYVRGARAVVRGEDLYSVSSHGLPFTYPPFSALLFVPASTLSTWLLQVLFTAGSIASYAIVVALVALRLELRRSDAVVIGLVGLAMEPLRFTITLGQVNLYLMMLVAVDCLLVPPKHRGWLLGIATGIKLIPGVFILFFLIKRDWGSALRAGSAFIATVLAGLFVAPSASHRYWLGAAVDFDRWGADTVAGVWNQSLHGVWIRHLASGPGTGVDVSVLLSAVALGLSVVAAYQATRVGNDVGAMLALAVGGLLASPISWTHHWVWITPLMLLFKAYRLWAYLIPAAALFWFGPFKLGSAGSDGLNALKELAAATYVAFGVLTLFLLLVRSSGSVRTAGDSRDI